MQKKLEAFLVGVGVLCIFAMCVLTTGSVLTRSLWAWGIPDSEILVRELMVGAIVLPLAAVSANRAHIAVEFLFNRFNGKTQRWLIAFGSLFGCLALVPLLYASWREVSHTINTGSFFFGDLSLPRWPGRVIFFVGMAIFQLRMVTLTIQDVSLALSGKSVSSKIEL